LKTNKWARKSVQKNDKEENAWTAIRAKRYGWIPSAAGEWGAAEGSRIVGVRRKLSRVGGGHDLFY
jgi:hypothetical protein